MSHGLLIAVFATGMHAQTAPPPPPSVPLLVHGYVYFDTGSAVPIRQSETDPIEYLGPRTPPDKFVYVRGQTDTVGTEEDDVVLSRARAYAVADLLVREGAAPERITIMPCGERILNRPTGDETPEPLNRFVLFDWSTRPPMATAQCPVEPYRR